MIAYGKNPRLDHQDSWYPCRKPRTADEVIELINLNPCTKDRYKITSNNCQHFASYLFHDFGDKGKRIKINRKRGNPACL